jgi:GTP cyclohydrolase III
MTKKTLTMLLATVAMAGLAGTAQASDKARAQDAIAEADARVEAAWAAGAGERAADTQAHATAALDRARHQLRKSNEHHAYYAAREADAYAQLALAVAQGRR